MSDPTRIPQNLFTVRSPLSIMVALAILPEKGIWLASQKSARTRRAYGLDVAHFLRSLGLADAAALRQIDHRAVIAWEHLMRETEGATPSTVRRRLAALSSLFKHTVSRGHATRDPVVDVARPRAQRRMFGGGILTLKLAQQSPQLLMLAAERQLIEHHPYVLGGLYAIVRWSIMSL